MIKKIEPYEEANLMNQFFLEGLKCWSYYGNNRIKEKWVKQFLIHSEMALKLEINEISFLFTTINQNIEEKIKEDPSIEIEFQKMLSKIGVGNYFESKTETNKQKFFHDIRNALAHANYDIYYNPEAEDFLDNYVYIENDKVKGKMKLKTLLEIKEKYIEINNSFDKNEEMLSNIEPIISLKTNNKKQYENAIDSIRLANFKKKKIKTNGAISIIIPNIIDEISDFLDIKELSEEQKKLIKNYINYNGLKRWNNYKKEVKQMALGLIAKYCFSNKIRLQGNTLYLTSRIATGKNNNSDMDVFAPIHYANLLMQYCFYNLNTFKERSKQLDIEELIYKTKELANIKYIKLYDCDKNDIEEKAIEKLKKEKERLKQSIESKEKQIEGIKESKKLSNEEKIEKLKERREEITTSSELIKKIDNELEELKEEKDTCSNYLASPEFFDRLRNSVSHGYFKIDYMNGLRTRNLENMEITFFDVNDKRKVFEFKIKVGELLPLFDILLGRVKEESPHYKKAVQQDMVTINESKNISDKGAQELSIKMAQKMVKQSNHTIQLHDKNGETTTIKGRKK